MAAEEAGKRPEAGASISSSGVVSGRATSLRAGGFANATSCCSASAALVVAAFHTPSPIAITKVAARTVAIRRCARLSIGPLRFDLALATNAVYLWSPLTAEWISMIRADASSTAGY